MTRNKEIELCKKASEIFKKDAMDHCKSAVINMLISTISSAAFTYLYIKLQFASPIYYTVIVLFGIMLVVSIAAVIVNCQGHKAFTNLINMREFVIIEEEYEEEPWYYVGIKGAGTFVRVEKVQQEQNGAEDE